MNPGATDLAALLELLILTEAPCLGKTENAFLFPSPQSLVRMKASALHPLTHQEAVLAAPLVPQGDAFFSTKGYSLFTAQTSEPVGGRADL